MPSKGSAHAGFRQSIFRGCVSRLRLRSLRLHLGNFRLGVAVFLFLFEQRGVGLGALQSVFGLLDFSGGSRALLLQPPVGVKITPGGVARTARLDQFRIDGEKFFLSAAVRKVRFVGLRSLHLSLRPGSLTTKLGVIELQKQLSLANMLSFFYEQLLYRGGNWRVGFEVLNRFYFAVGRNQAADWTAFHCGSAHLHWGWAA